MPDGFLLLIESVIGRPFMAVDGKWRPGVERIRPLRTNHGLFFAEGQKTCCLRPQTIAGCAQQTPMTIAWLEMKEAAN
jgi:hypothetical protein